MLTIGQFSKVCQVSVKALHHYDRIGLLHPCSVDRWTGYRYYEEAQIPEMLLIQRLKRYGFSLAEIGAFLECPDADQSLLRMKARRAALTADMEQTALIIREMEHHMRNMERTGTIMGYQNEYQITVEQRTDVPVLAIRQKMAVEDFGKYYGKLFETVTREQIITNGLVMAIYHDDAFDPACSDIELAVGVRDPAQATRVLSGGTAAVTVHKGPYSGLSDAYGAITRWMTENGYSLTDAPYEIYTKTHFDGLAPEEWETEIIFPIEKK